MKMENSSHGHMVTQEVAELGPNPYRRMLKNTSDYRTIQGPCEWTA